MKHTPLLILLLLSFSAGAQSWNPIGNVGFSADSVWWTSMVIDKNNTPYVAYADYSNGRKATVVKYINGNWATVGKAGFSAGQAQYISIALDNNGTPYVVYQDWGYGGKATVMKYNGSNWDTVGNPGFSEQAASDPSIAIDANGTPYIACIIGDYISSAVLMKFDGNNWQTISAYGSSGFAACGTSVAIDRNNTLYMAFVEGDMSGCGAQAMIVKCVGSSCSSIGNGFYSLYGNATALAIDTSGSLYVAYSGDIYKYNDSTWEILNNIWGAMAIGRNNKLYVAYSDKNYGYALTTRMYNDTGWVTIGNPGFSAGMAYYTTMAIDTSGAPCVAYVDVVNNQKVTVMRYGVAFITGSGYVCVGDTTKYYDISPFGVWGSSDTTVATIDAVSGIVTGIAAGTAVISYTVSDNSSVTTVTVNPCHNLNNIGTLAIFPNPTTGPFTLNISSPQPETATITITNILGEKIKQLTTTTNHDTQIQLDSAPGVYFISATTSHGTNNAKVELR